VKLQRDQVNSFIELLREHHAQDAKGSFSESKVRSLIDKEIDNPKTLILTNKQITAVLILVLLPSHFTTKFMLQEVCFYSKTAGSGFRLLKEAVEWIRGWGDSLEYKTFMSTGTDDTNRMLERFGMKQIGKIYDMEGVL